MTITGCMHEGFEEVVLECGVLVNGSFEPLVNNMTVAIFCNYGWDAVILC